MYCRSCGAQNGEGAMFCASCGAPLSNAQSYGPGPIPDPHPDPKIGQTWARPNTNIRHTTKPVSVGAVVGTVLSALIVVSLIFLPWMSLGAVPRAFVDDLKPLSEDMDQAMDSLSRSERERPILGNMSVEDLAGLASSLKADYTTFEAGALTSQVSELLTEIDELPDFQALDVSLEPIAEALDTATPISAGTGIAALVAGALCLAANISYLASGRRPALRVVTIVTFALVAVIGIAWIVGCMVANGQISSAVLSLVNTGELLESGPLSVPLTKTIEAFLTHAISFPFFSMSLGAVAAIALALVGVVVSALPTRKAQ